MLLHVCVFFVLGLHLIYPLRPQSVHQWRQCDSASYSLNYFEQETGFFFPQAMNLAGFKGHMVSEFPLLYWITGKLYGVFGFHEGIARFVTYFVFLLGLWAVFELGLRLFKNKGNAFLPVLLIYSSPCVVYYAFNFLPNIPAFSLSLVAWLFFFRYLDKRDVRDFLICSGIATLASLLKPIEVFNYLIMLALLVLEYFTLFGFSYNEQSSVDKKKILFYAISLLVVNYAWIDYARAYADAFGNHANLLGILPIWRMDAENIAQTCKAIGRDWVYQFFWTPAYLAFGASLVLFGVFFNKVNKYLAFSIIFSIISQAVYAILFFETFRVHDYYMLNIFIIPALLVFALVQIGEKQLTNFVLRKVTLVCLAFFFFMSIKHSRFILHERYFGVLKTGINENLQTIEPYLRSIGVKKNDLVVSVPDVSPNISLYMMGQKGWTEAYTGDTYGMDYFYWHDAKYLIVNGEIHSHKEWYEPHLKNQVGDYKGIKIYKLR